jgi:hypothetical protein
MPDARRTARVLLGKFEIARLLQLPEGLSIRFIEQQNDPVRLMFIVEGESLQPVPDGVESPRLASHVVTHCVSDREGRMYVRHELVTGDLSS